MLERQEQQEDNAKKFEEAEEDQVETGVMNTRAEFDRVILWGHESVADASSDPYARGLEELVHVADRASKLFPSIIVRRHAD